jgi:hypothetical protein
MKKLFLILLLAAFVAACGAGKYTVDTTGLTPQQAKVAELKVKALESREWLNATLASYKAELSIRTPEMRKDIHAKVKPVLGPLTLGLDTLDVALAASDGVEAETEYQEFMRLKTRLIALFAQLALKTK